MRFSVFAVTSILTTAAAFHQIQFLTRPRYSSQIAPSSNLFQAYLDNEYGEPISVENPSTAPIFKADYKKMGLSYPAIFPFGKGKSGPGMENRFILGGKGANLAEMSRYD